MASASGVQRARYAIVAFGYCHLALLLGIVEVAAGLEPAVAHPFDALRTTPAVALAGGAAVFLAGDVLFRRTLGIAAGRARALAAVALLATIPVGTGVSALAQLALIVVLFAGGLALGPADA